MLVRPGASGSPGLDRVIMEPWRLFKLQPMEGDELAGRCMVGASGSVKPRARGLRQCGGYFTKLFAVACHQGGQGGRPHVPHAAPQHLSTCTPTVAEPPQPHTQRWSCLRVPQPSTISHKPLRCGPAAAASGCTPFPQTCPCPHSAPRDTATGSPAPQPGNRASWCHNPLVPSQLSPGPLTSSEDVPLSRAG